jgi:tetratricopeptide (TPR) repeat protein
VDELRRVVRLDPFNKSGVSLLALALTSARQFPEARAVAQGVLDTDPDFVLGMQVMGLVLALGGEPDCAVKLLERGTRLYPDAPRLQSELVFAYAAAGRWEDARRLRAQLIRRRADQSGGVDAAFTALVFGDSGPVLNLLTTDAGRRAWYEFAGFGCSPVNDPLWNNDRFVSMMREFSIAPCSLSKPWPIPPRN